MKFLLSLTLALLQHTSHASGFATVKGPSTSPIIPTTLKLLHPRGGNIPTSHAASASEYDSNSSDDDGASESSEVDLVTSRFADIAAQNAKKMSNFSMDPSSRRQLSNSYSLAAAFWTSLTFDSLLNKKKRSLLFPGSAEFGGRMWRGNLAVSASLASGFMLSAGLAYFLHKDLKKDDVSWDEELKSEAMRKKLHLLLFVYGTGNLFANINPGSAPFLGMGGFVINFHNALIALNGWRKESSSSASAGSGQLLKTVASLPKNLFRTPDLSMGFRVRVMSSLYMIASIIAALRGFGIISNSLVPHYLTCLAYNSFSVAPVDQLQLIGLKWAALSRTILAGGTCVLLKDQVDNGRLRCSNTKFLVRIISLCSLSVGIPAIISNSVEYFSSGFKLILFGLMTGFSSLM